MRTSDLKRDTVSLLGPLMLLTCALLGSTASAAMIKEVAIGQFTDAPSEVEADHYYLRTHGPQIVRLSGPWLRRYVAFRSYDAGFALDPALGLRRGLYGELWFESVEDYKTRPPLEGVSMPFWLKPGERGDRDKALITVTAAPEHVLLPATAEVMGASVVRWITLIEYPSGVSRADGDRWFWSTYAPEASKQPGLLRFVCNERNPSDQKGENGDWVRLCEYWYADIAAFRNAVVANPPHYSTPPWGGRFPFVRLASTLIGSVPEIDFLK